MGAPDALGGEGVYMLEEVRRGKCRCCCAGGDAVPVCSSSYCLFKICPSFLVRPTSVPILSDVKTKQAAQKFMDLIKTQRLSCSTGKGASTSGRKSVLKQDCKGSPLVSCSRGFLKSLRSFCTLSVDPSIQTVDDLDDAEIEDSFKSCGRIFDSHGCFSNSFQFCRAFLEVLVAL